MPYPGAPGAPRSSHLVRGEPDNQGRDHCQRGDGREPGRPDYPGATHRDPVERELQENADLCIGSREPR